MLVANIKISAQDYFPETLDATKIDRFIAAAVREYSRWNPLINSTTITTVDDQQSYTVPGAIDILNCYWYPGSNVNEIENLQFYNVLWSEVPASREISLPIIHDIVKNARTDRSKGRWDWKGDKLWLYPEPESNTDVVVVNYTSAHLLAEGAYATIPDKDFDIIVKLTLAEAWLSVLMDQIMQGKHATGIVKQEYDPVATQRLIDELKSSVKQYDGPVIVGG